MRLQVKVTPGSRTSAFEQTPGGAWVARLKSPPVDGKANQELIALVAAHFKRPKSAVAIKAGAAARVKIVTVDGV